MAPMGWAEFKRKFEMTNFVKGRIDKQSSSTTSPSVKGKKEIARSRALKILTKLDNVKAGE